MFTNVLAPLGGKTALSDGVPAPNLERVLLQALRLVRPKETTLYSHAATWARNAIDMRCEWQSYLSEVF